VWWRERTTVEKIQEREDRRRGASLLGRLRINTALARYRDVTHLLPVLVFQKKMQALLEQRWSQLHQRCQSHHRHWCCGSDEESRSNVSLN
jgi:hypothetical protein